MMSEFRFICYFYIAEWSDERIDYVIDLLDDDEIIHSYCGNTIKAYMTYIQFKKYSDYGVYRL